LLACAQFQNLAQQNEHGDDGGGFVINRNDAVLPQILREQARREGRGEAVQISGADAQRDQAEHVQRSIAHRGPAADEKQPTRPQHDRRGEQELDPNRQLRRDEMVEVQTRKVRAHFQDDDGDGQRGADPEAPRHVE